jgi:TDG/mug DNA glycosylase family protein
MDALATATAPGDIVPDLLRPGLDLVICGTAAGAISAARGAYYANPGNRFWGVLAETGLTPRKFRPEEYPHLLDLSIGLTDVCKTAFGQDEDLPRNGFDQDRLAASMRHFRPLILAFNGKRAGSEFLSIATGRIAYGLQLALADMPLIMVLPSTSGLACRAWDAAPWHAMASLVFAMRERREAERPKADELWPMDQASPE